VRYSIRTVGPQGEADSIPLVLSLAVAKAHLKVDFATDDTLITGYIASAQDAVERHTSQVLTQRVMELAVAGFPLGCRAAAQRLFRDPARSRDGDRLDRLYGWHRDRYRTGRCGDWRWSESAPTLVRPAFGDELAQRGR
jgi:uncharacterized phage protein (predicted DNA packaging)